MVVRKMVAEFVGTFALVFIGCGAIIAQSALGGIILGPTPTINPSSYVGVAFAFGLTIMVMVYAVGSISGAHFNPAVTVGFAIAGRFPWRYVPHYLAAEFGGAITASFIHWAILPESPNVYFGATTLGPGVSIGGGVAIEVILTFLLMFVIMSVATDVRFPSAASGLAIGLTVALDALAGGAFTGASMNPARSFGPALFAGLLGGAPEVLGQFWIYLLAPPLGAVLAALLYEYLRPQEFARRGVPEDLMEMMKG